MAFDAGAARVADQDFDFGRWRAVDDRGDAGGQIAVGDDGAVERDDAAPLRDPRKRADLEQQRLGREPAARQDAKGVDCTGEIGRRRAQDHGG